MRVPQRLGPYELLGILGQGAMGAVYRARHTEMGAVRAVKVLLGSSPTQAERFLRESRNLARIRHPNVVGVHESGAENGHLYYAMDLVDGRPLDEVLAEGRLPFERALELAIGICRGVDALHSEGIVHRDLKPANVVLDRHGSPIVLDLGLAIAPELDQRLTKTGAFVGTPWYMAPEQARGERATPRTDVYALGLIAHELTSGYSVCESGELPGFVEVPLPSSIDTDLPRALDRVCARATATSPDARFERASQLADALAAVQQDPGITRRTVRRLKLAAAGTLACGAVGVALAWPTSPSTRVANEAPSDATTPSDTGGGGASAALRAEQVSKGRRELRRVRRLQPSVRHAELLEWLEQFPAHPDEDLARTLLRDARLRFPLRDVFRGPAPNGRVAFIDSNRLAWQRITSEGSGELQLLQLDPPRALRDLPAVSRYTALAASIDGRWVAFSERRGTWLLDTKLPDAKPVRVTTRFMTRLVFSPDGRTLAGGGLYKEVRLYDLEQPGFPDEEIGPYRGNVNAIAFSPDGRYLVVAAGGSFTHREGNSESLDLWDLQSRDAVYRAGVFSRVNAVAFSPTEPYFVAGSSDGRLTRFDFTSQAPGEQYEGHWKPGSLQGENPSAHERSIRGVAFTPDGRYLQSIGPTDYDKAGTRRIWDATTRELLATIDHKTPASRMAFSPDGKHLVIVTDTAIALWDPGVPPRLLDDAPANGPQPGEGK